MKRLSLRALCALSVIAFALSFSLAIPTIQAQTQTQSATPTDAGLTDVGRTVRLSGTDPRTIVVRIINISLSLIGIILVSIIVYAGFLWMTSGGNPEKIEKAKMYLRNAIIGVIIILSAWAITKFILNALLDSTNGRGGSSSQQGGPRPNGSFGFGGSSSGFVLEGIEPAGSVGIRNVQVRFLFSQPINPDTANRNLRVIKAEGNTVVTGRFETDGNLVTFTPSAPCPAPHADRFCLEANVDYIARVDASTTSTQGQVIACGGLGAVCEGRFRTGELVDVTAPTVTFLQPFDGQSLPQNSSVELIASASDEGGVSMLRFSADGREVRRTMPPARQTPTAFEGRVQWNTEGVSLGAHQLMASAFDTDSNRVDSSAVTVMIRPVTCFNQQQDEAETGIDCGGACGACMGQACQVGADCSGGVCTGGVCVERPIITAITPNSGRVGTIVTISGLNFGATTGEVTFTGGVRASFPQACSEAGTGWSNQAIIIEVPVGAQTGPITVKNVTSNLTDGSDDSVGPRVGAYTVNNVTHPGLCAIAPDHGAISTAVRLDGSGFGSSSDRVRVSDTTVTAFRGWTDRQILMNIPAIPNGIASVRALVGEAQSNPVPFRIEVTESTAPPVIDAVAPATGPIGEYMTVRGRNFGSRAGAIRVVGPAGAEGDADTTFPEACDQATRYWSDTSVTFKVPPTLRGTGLGGTVPVAAGSYRIFVQRQDGSVPSNRADITVTSGEPNPGLCAVTPDTGPIGTEVSLHGERFGGDQGIVSFQGPGRSVDAISILEWTDQRVRATVPAGAATGAVTVKKNNQTSNPLPYTVRNCAENASICSESERCCEGSGVCVARAGGVCPALNRSAHYAWRLSTGELPIYPEVVDECNPASRRLASPSPSAGRPGGDQACVNSDIIIRFTTKLDRGLISGTTIVVRQCADATADCSGGTVVSPAVGFPRAETADTNSDLVRFRPSANSQRWSPGTNYQVFLTTGIKSDRGIAMPERAAECGTGNAYCFRFATRTSAEVCAVGAVLVNPSTYRFQDIDNTTDVHANPLAADDACLQLNPDSYPWSWRVVDRASRSDARVTVSENAGPLGQSADQNALSRAEVDEQDPALVTASMTAGRTAISGFSEMSVELRPFIVDDYGPDCDAACTNAAIWAKLSVRVLPSSVTPANVELRRCVDVGCVAMDEPISLAASAIRLMAVPGEAAVTGLGRFISINPMPNLRAGQTYRVLLKSGAQGGIVSIRGQSLASVNDPRGFAWNFHVKTENNGLCTVERVLLAPGEKVETVIGARQRFTAVPVSPPDACSETGQLLIGDQPYAWSVVDNAGAPDPAIARLIQRTDDREADNAPEDALAPVRAGRSTSDEQLAEIIATRDPGEGETRLMTNVQATYDNRSGRANYGLLCGQRFESSCPAGAGLTAGGCCAPRPVIISRYPGILPSPSGDGICRNTEIFADFQVPMNSGTISNGVILAKKITAVTCPASTLPLDRALLGLNDPWYSRAWRHVVAFFRPEIAQADIWCVGAVPGQVEIRPQGTGSRVIYRIQSALEANTIYRVYVRGADNLATATATSTGIRSERGVLMAQEAVEWTFRTGTRICEANNLLVTDASPESPYLYTHEPESHEWHSDVQAITEGGQAVPITSVREYTWDWGPWLSSKRDVLTTNVADLRAPTRATVATVNKNGQAFISARFQITRDEVNVPSSTGRVIEAAKSAVVNLCERPWPNLALGSFTDGAGSASLRALAPIFAAGPQFYNFSTMYCMDGADKRVLTDDLPSMRLAPVPIGPTERDQGIVRQYLFTFDEPAFRGDGIGIRIASNPQHLSAARWYASRGFAGAATPMTVDGYDAVRSGETVYISGSNLDMTAVSSSIYIISRNPNASEQTTNIFDQLIANFLLNTNLSVDTSNVCVRPMAAGGARVELRNNRPIDCSANWECGVVDPVLRCASAKSKMQRDRARISDFQTFNIELETYHQRTGKYPALKTGSFLPAMSTSRWPSWDQALSAEVGGEGGSLPRDPVNRFSSCGRCRAGDGTLGHICSETGECATGETCAAMTFEDAARTGFDPATCWNPTSQSYLCPAIQVNGQTAQASHVYQYRAIDQGTRYELSTNLEGPAATQYRPALITALSRCTNTNLLCTSDGQCTNGGTCRPTGGSWRYGGMCNNQQYATASSCTATGPLGSSQTCHMDQTQAVACMVNGQPGTKIQICSDCTLFVDGPQTVCTPNISCGNGRIDVGESCDDGSNNGRYGFCSRTCQQGQGLCGDGVVGGGETCDNGSPVGTAVPGTSGVNGAYCRVDGTGAIQTCSVNQSCSSDCRGPAPYCGDRIVSAPEQCDGNTLQTGGKLCVRTVAGAGLLLGSSIRVVSENTCTTVADCAAGETCGGTPQANDCPTQQVYACSGGTSSGVPCTLETAARDCTGGGRCIGLTYPTFHVRTCQAAGTANQCSFNRWSACQRLSSCGDGVLDAGSGEECDDGTSGNSGTGRCTPSCKLNICGDGYAQATAEDCDWGGRNGVRPPTVQYGSPAPICTTSCRYSAVSGGYCGNGIIESAEACDGAAVPLDATCRSAGYDYAAQRTTGGRDALSCSNRCEIAGCQLCSALLPTGQGADIRAKVVDGILQNRGLPQARVALRYNGARVAETFTDENGYFQFSGLHNNEACGNYSIGISLQGVKYDYSRRVLVTTSDPNDGYYAFASASFNMAPASPSTFTAVVGRQSGTDQVILLMPHPGEGETIVVREWNNRVAGRTGVDGRPQVGQLIDPQLLLPRSLGYQIITPPDVLYGRCIVGTPNVVCHRTINWVSSAGGSRRGSLNMSVPPNAGLACYEGTGDNTCSSYDAVAETIMYKRAIPTPTAVYRYFLVDASTTDGDNDGNLDTLALQNKIRIIWRDYEGMEHYQEISPMPLELSPTPAGATRGGDGRCRKFWHVFDQDSVTGNITIVNKYMCKSTVPSIDPEYSQILDDDGQRKNIESVLTDTF